MEGRIDELKDGGTDGQTEGQTDTISYRDELSHKYTAHISKAIVSINIRKLFPSF